MGYELRRADKLTRAESWIKVLDSSSPFFEVRNLPIMTIERVTEELTKSPKNKNNERFFKEKKLSILNVGRRCKTGLNE